MKISKKSKLFSLLLPPLVIISSSLPLCSCGSKNDEFNNLYYGDATPKINKKNRKKVMDIAANHFKEQWSVIDYGTTISETEFEQKIQNKPITCYEYYWNVIYYMGSKCTDNESYQVIQWGDENNPIESEDRTITSDIILKYNDEDYILSPKTSADVFEYDYDNEGTIFITFANDDRYAIPSYVASCIKVKVS